MMPRLSNSQRGGIIFRLAFYVFLIAFLFVVYLVRHPLLRLASGFWIVNESPVTSDAIVILSDDNYNGDRAAEAANIFKAGWAPRVIASGRYLRPYAGIAELEARDLESHGVPEKRGDAFLASRPGYAGRVHRDRSADFIARLETDFVGHVELPHAPLKIYLRTRVPAGNRATRDRGAGCRV